MSFTRMKLTTFGSNLEAKAVQGKGLHLTRVALGDGLLGNGSMVNRTSLVSERLSLGIDAIRVTNDGLQSSVIATLDNREMTEGFLYRELAVMGRDPDTNQEGVYLYDNAGQECEYLDIPENGVVIYEQIRVLIRTEGMDGVTFDCSGNPVYLSTEDLDAHNKDQAAHSGMFISKEEKGAPSGVATLGEDGKLLGEQLQNHANKHAATGSDPITPAMIGAAVNTNLLHNWYFANCVNQRGLTEYAADATAWIHTIDGWKMMIATLTVKDGYCNFAVPDGTGGYKRLMQLTEHTLFAGETYTISLLAKVNDVGVMAMFRPCTSTYGQVSGAPGLPISAVTAAPTLYTYTFTPTEDVARVGVEILVYKIAGYYFDADIYAIKLERGGVQTLAHQDSSGNWVLNEVPDYGEELLKCIQSTADSADTYANKTIATTDYAVNKAGDTMAGALVAHNDTDYSTYKIRNAAILSATPSSMTNGTVAFVYK